MDLTRPLRRRLLTALDTLAVLDTAAGRDRLLRDLPAGLVNSLPRHAAKAVDLDAIVDGCARWQPLPGNEHPLQILIENAGSLAQGQQAEAELQAVLDTLQGQPVQGLTVGMRAVAVPDLPPAASGTI